jgi:hypothetical protein
MKQPLSENRYIFIFIGIAIVFIIVGVNSDILPFVIFALILLAGALWVKANLASVDFNTQWLFVEKQGERISVPLDKVDYITELTGQNMSICFLGFKSPTIFGDRVMFFGFPYRKSVDQVVKIAKDKGFEIRVIRWF